jgi:hypothetical protein
MASKSLLNFHIYSLLNPALKTESLFYLTPHLSVTDHASRITYHASRITYHASRITPHVLRIHLSDYFSLTTTSSQYPFGNSSVRTMSGSIPW